MVELRFAPLCEQNDVFRAGLERNWRGPVELAEWVGDLLDSAGFRARGEDGEPAVWSDQLAGGRDGGGHVVDGAEGYAVEFLLEFFCAGAVDFGAQAEGADGFAEEGGFLVLGFGEGYGDFRAHEGDGDAGESGAGAEVEQGLNAGGEGDGAEDGLEEVAAENSLFIADGGQVGFRIPFLEEGQVGGELLALRGSEGWVIGLLEEIVQGVCRHRAILVRSVRGRFARIRLCRRISYLMCLASYASLANHLDLWRGPKTKVGAGRALSRRRDLLWFEEKQG